MFDDFSDTALTTARTPASLGCSTRKSQEVAAAPVNPAWHPPTLPTISQHLTPAQKCSKKQNNQPRYYGVVVAADGKAFLTATPRALRPLRSSMPGRQTPP